MTRKTSIPIRNYFRSQQQLTVDWWSAILGKSRKKAACFGFGSFCRCVCVKEREREREQVSVYVRVFVYSYLHIYLSHSNCRAPKGEAVKRGPAEKTDGTKNRMFLTE